jgi:modification methylase
VVNFFQTMGFDVLPVILWRKQTNAPNKFMGSGMLPAGAYVTLEHEYILVFRKGAKRVFKSADEKALRRRSAFFWEERNRWFSDIWLDLKGVPQSINRGGLRVRSGAFPFELAYRLVNMYSVQTDLVLDPFVGTGTTVLAAITGGRNSIGVEIDDGFIAPARKSCLGAAKWLNSIITRRLFDHVEFVNQYTNKKGRPKHTSTNYRFPVVTKQETDMALLRLDAVDAAEDGRIVATYSDMPPLSAEHEDSKAPPTSRRQSLLFDL